MRRLACTAALALHLALPLRAAGGLTLPLQAAARSSEPGAQADGRRSVPSGEAVAPRRDARASGDPRSGCVERACAAFETADRDGDGRITLGEAIRAKIPARDFAREDADRDAQLTRDELVLYYRQLLRRAERPVQNDLENEAARIQALRRAKQGACGAPSAGAARAPAGAARVVARPSLTTNGPAAWRLRGCERASAPPAEPAPAAEPPVLATSDD